MSTIKNIGGNPHIIFSIRDIRFELILHSKNTKTIKSINIIDKNGNIKTGYKFVRGRVNAFYNGYTTIRDKGILNIMDFTMINNLWNEFKSYSLTDYSYLGGFEEIFY